MTPATANTSLRRTGLWGRSTAAPISARRKPERALVDYAHHFPALFATGDDSANDRMKSTNSQRSPSVMPLMRFASVKSAGVGSYRLASRPSPLPVSPWQCAHLSAYTSRADFNAGAVACNGFFSCFASSGTGHDHGALLTAE